MHCPVYNWTARSALCLEYQKRARGESLPKKSIYNHPSEGSILWAIKYKPCLDCETGRQIKESGGNDADVENLIATRTETEARQLKRCVTCKQEKPLEAFGRNRTNKDGLQVSCRECQAISQKKSYQKLKELKVQHAEHIDQIAPNIAPQAIAKQSIEQNAQELQAVNIDHIADKNNMVVDSPADKERKCQICKGWYFTPPRDFTHEPNICDMCWESDRHMNTPIPPPPPVESTPESMPTHGERTCTRCGWTGPEKKFHTAGHTGIINVCRKCVFKARQANAEQKAKAITEIGEFDLVVSFADYPDILDTLCAAAKKNFRTLSNEILFRLVNYEKPT